MLAVVAPGQGAQKPSMLSPWLELDGARDSIARWSTRAELDLAALGTDPEANVTDTAHAQPLLAALALLSAGAIFAPEDAAGAERLALAPLGTVVAGHSVGEFPAAVLAGALAPEEAIALVALRGRLMADAAAREPSSMAAVIGGEPELVEAAAAAAGAHAANFNGGGQIVIAGSTASLQAFAAAPPPGCRVVPLQVAGAFHTSFMEPARAGLSEALAALAPGESETRLAFVSNRDGAALRDVAAIRSCLAGQVTRPVRWDECQATFADLGVTGLLELAPGGVLAGLARRALPDVKTFAVKKPADLEGARAFVAEHAATPTPEGAA